MLFQIICFIFSPMYQAKCASKTKNKQFVILCSLVSFAAATKRFVKTLLSPAVILDYQFSMLTSTISNSSDDQPTPHLTYLPHHASISCAYSGACASKKQSIIFPFLKICFALAAQCTYKLTKVMSFYVSSFLTRAFCAN